MSSERLRSLTLILRLSWLRAGRLMRTLLLARLLVHRIWSGTDMRLASRAVVVVEMNAKRHTWFECGISVGRRRILHKSALRNRVRVV